jgi:hypothetical protein
MHQAFCLGWNWLSEQGDNSAKNKPIVFGPTEQMTQELMHSDGVKEAREEFIRNGGVQSDRSTPPNGTPDPYPYKATIKNYSHNFWQGNVTASYLGSYTVTIVNNGDSTATFTIRNTSGLKSVTHNYLPYVNFDNPSIQTLIEKYPKLPENYPSKSNLPGPLGVWESYAPSGLLNDVPRNPICCGAIYQVYTWTEMIPLP